VGPATAVLLSLAALSSCQDTTPSRDRRILWFHADPAGAAAEPFVDSTLAVFTTLVGTGVVALEARTGALRWQRNLPLAAGVPTNGMPKANIAAYEDLILVPGWDLFGLDRSTGAVRWQFQRPDDYPGWGSVFVANGRLYAAGRYLYALAPATGALLWRADLGEQPFRPIVVDGVIYVGTRREIAPGALGEGHAMAVDAATGVARWQFPIPDVGNWLGGSVGPVFVEDSVVLIAGENGRVYALDRATGQLQWTYAGSGPYSGGVVVVDRTVIVAGDAGSIEGVDLATGGALWHTGPGSSVLEPITVGDGVALVSVGAVFAFAPNGTVRWQDGGAAWGGPLYSTAASYRAGMVYVGAVGPDAGSAGFYALRAP